MQGEDTNGAQGKPAGARSTTTSAPAVFAKTETSRTGASGSEFVAMMQASKPRYGNSLRVHSRTLSRFASGWRFLAQAEMCPVVMIVANVLRHESLQMAWVERNDVIEQHSAACAYPSFGNAILPWASNRRSHWLDAEIHNSLHNLTIESVLAIEDQKTRR